MQRGVGAFDDVLARQAAVVGTGLKGWPGPWGVPPQKILVEITRSLRRQPAFLMTCAHDGFGHPAGVDLGVVEEIHAGVVGRLHALVGLGHVQLVLEGDPGAEGQGRDLQADLPRNLYSMSTPLTKTVARVDLTSGQCITRPLPPVVANIRNGGLNSGQWDAFAPKIRLLSGRISRVTVTT